jgi:hypothetical protein
MAGVVSTIAACAVALIVASLAAHARAQSSHFDELADQPFNNGFLSKGAITADKDELAFERAVQSSTRPGSPATSKRWTDCPINVACE